MTSPRRRPSNRFIASCTASRRPRWAISGWRPCLHEALPWYTSELLNSTGPSNCFRPSFETQPPNQDKYARHIEVAKVWKPLESVSPPPPSVLATDAIQPTKDGAGRALPEMLESAWAVHRELELHEILSASTTRCTGAKTDEGFAALRGRVTSVTAADDLQCNALTSEFR